MVRADKRKFTNFVVAEGAKPITWKGETYKPGETIRVSDEDYFNAGSKLPPGLQDASIYTANASAIAARANATNKFNNKLLEMKIIKGKRCIIILGTNILVNIKGVKILTSRSLKNSTFSLF